MSTQNSGVSIEATTICRASVKDSAQVDVVSYYGVIRKIILLDYHKFQIPAFKCDWANKGHSVRIEDGFTVVNLHQAVITFLLQYSFIFAFPPYSLQQNTRKMKIEGFEPIFGEPKAEWADSRSDSLGRFLFHVSAPDSSHLLIQVTDFRSNTWEAKRSVLQLDDVRDEIGIGGSWSEFIDYVVASIKSEDVKLILEGHSNADGAAYAKIVAQKSKGMPRISISLTRLTGSAATEAMAKLSLELFTAFRSMQTLIVQEQERCLQLEKEAAAEKVWYFWENDISSHKDEDSDKQAAQSPVASKVANRVIPAHRRAKVRGALLQDTEDDKDN
ncbi:U2 small nuclear ribonucleoprotein auxiliary factor-like protein [Citrus sinensis]|uniref:U2 small nuclear ribonucleoprotein auxiliary factor-like protein n=1 Tax=Citrus sinensis TaxID=2711 RepID=A0ACB8JIH4_CITSI|nr:U2 small nuclear ribonucleoprotein auxiliary factor-like protein [Citrus sinensis]